MTLLAPNLLYLLPLTSLPLLFHLFFRIRRRRIRFPALLFFTAADPRVHYRRKLREWFLLILRTLALLCFILGLSRPTLQRGAGHPDKLAVIVDNSASMYATDLHGHTRLSRALSRATLLLENGGGKLTSLSATTPDARSLLPDTYSASPAPLVTTANTIRETSATGRPLDALRKAIEAGSKLPGLTELHLITDLSGPEWSNSTTTDPLPPTIRLFIHQIATPQDRSEPLLIISATPPSTAPLAGQPWRTAIALANRSSSAVTTTISCQTANNEWSQVVTIAGNTTNTLHATMPGLPAGRHAATVTLHGQAVTGFDKAFFEVTSTPPATVIIIDAGDSSGLLGAALDPLGDGRLSGLHVKHLDTSATSEDLLNSNLTPPLVAADYLSLLHHAPQLKNLAEQGTTILTYPPPQAHTPVTLPVWCGASILPVTPPPPSAASASINWSDPLWHHIPRPTADTIEATPACRLTLHKQSRPLITLNSDPLLALCELGQGRVIVSAITLDTTASSWPRRPFFVPMMLALPTPPAAPHYLHTIAAHPLATPANPTTTEIRTAKGRLYASYPPNSPLISPAIPGHYALINSTNHLTLTVSPDIADAPTLTSYPTKKLPAWAADAILITPGSTNNTLQQLSRHRRGLDLSGPLLVTALLAAIAELIVAHHRFFRHG